MYCNSFYLWFYETFILIKSIYALAYLVTVLAYCPQCQYSYSRSKVGGGGGGGDKGARRKVEEKIFVKTKKLFHISTKTQFVDVIPILLEDFLKMSAEISSKFPVSLIRFSFHATDGTNSAVSVFRTWCKTTDNC